VRGTFSSVVMVMGSWGGDGVWYGGGMGTASGCWGGGCVVTTSSSFSKFIKGVIRAARLWDRFHPVSHREYPDTLLPPASQACTFRSSS